MHMHGGREVIPRFMQIWFEIELGFIRNWPWGESDPIQRSRRPPGNSACHCGQTWRRRGTGGLWGQWRRVEGVRGAMRGTRTTAGELSWHYDGRPQVGRGAASAPTVSPLRTLGCWARLRGKPEKTSLLWFVAGCVGFKRCLNLRGLPKKKVRR